VPAQPALFSKEDPVPTYQYACTECGEPLEVVQKFSDASLTECPSCGGRLRKVFSAAAIVFRGSGFYRTDSRSGAGSTSTSKESKDSAKGGGSPESSDSSGSSGSSGSSDSSSAKSSESTGSSKSSSTEKVA
jgi:putative FmdB family regulatory protein